MTTVLHAVGIDPGLVHTGVVSIRLDVENLKLSTNSTLIDGPDASAIRTWVDSLGTPDVFIEKYRPRAHFSTDERMVKAERDIKRIIRGAVLVNNTGLIKVVTQDLLELLGLWRFTTVSHHQDLRAASRIAVLGILKDPEKNTHLTRYVKKQVLDA